MDGKTFYITKAKLQELEKEYAELLELEHHKDLGQEVPKILESEDLNPEFVSFQEDIGFLRARIDELKNIIERILIMTPGRIVTPSDIPDLQFEKGLTGLPYPGEDGGGVMGTMREAREEFERGFIVQKLEENDWNISRTADAIELERSNLHRKIKSYGIDVRK